MARQPQPDSIPDDEPHIETPVIDIQDLEHNPGPDTRVSNKGLRIEPTLGTADEHAFARDDEAVLAALEELEKSIRGQLPG